MHFSGTDIFRIYFLDKWLTCSCNFRIFYDVINDWFCVQISITNQGDKK